MARAAVARQARGAMRTRAVMKARGKTLCPYLERVDVRPLGVAAQVARLREVADAPAPRQ